MADAADAVTVTVSALGDYQAFGSLLILELVSETGSTFSEILFGFDGEDCTVMSTTLQIPAAAWNQAGLNGDRMIEISGTSIQPTLCEPDRFTAIAVESPDRVSGLQRQRTLGRLRNQRRFGARLGRRRPDRRLRRLPHRPGEGGRRTLRLRNPPTPTAMGTARPTAPIPARTGRMPAPWTVRRSSSPWISRFRVRSMPCLPVA